MTVPVDARRLPPLLEAARPHHWIKNLVVFAAPLFALALTPSTLLHVVLAFAAFCAAASGFYLLNDARDAEVDRRHPAKRHRPIASGRLSQRRALLVGLALLGLGLALGFAAGPLAGATVGAYALLQTAYNLGLKRVPVADVAVVAAGFVLRALGGAAAARVPASDWFLLCVGLLALFLALGKRRAELVALGAEPPSRRVLRFYSVQWLERAQRLVTGGALIAYTLWTFEGAETPWMLATLPFVLFVIVQYEQIARVEGGETPERTLVLHPSLLVGLLLWALTSLLVLLLTEGV